LASTTAGDAASSLRRSPAFGLGPRKADEAAAIDNEYLLVITRYGLVGLVAYLMLWGCLLRAGVRRARYDGTLGAAVAGVTLGLLAFSVVAGSLYQMQLMDVFWLAAGLALAAGVKPGAAPGHDT
jgi:hypothetical protein